MSIDSRLKLLSHSSIRSFHTCPRKYQLTKTYPEAVRESNVDLDFGSAFGEGIQALIEGCSMQDAVFRAILQWSGDLTETKKDKSIWTCISGMEKFLVLRDMGTLADYEIAYWKGKPCTELSFRITLPEGFYYRGYLDMLLRHKLSGELLVVDIKTSGANYSNPAKYVNSGQNIGYSIVVDKIAPGTSSFEVMYYEYLTGVKKFVEHTFMVGVLARANWLRNIRLDINTMLMYDKLEVNEWPQHGESCSAHNSQCQFIDVCMMTNKSLLGELELRDAKEIDAVEEYDIEVSFEELISNQLDRIRG